MHQLAEVKERRASFIEEKNLAALSAPVRSTGVLVYRRPSHLEKITIQPEPESLIADGERLTITEGNEPPRVLDLHSQPEIRALVDTVRALLSGDLALLQQYYQLGFSGGYNGWALTLSPVNAAVARFVGSITVEGIRTDILMITTVGPNGDADRMAITPAP
ncbi:MAG: outer membrane lipoprotein carrier protein LolA [Acetobacteraceae bacterium]|nr:outer membrane lipoprotein carrier protein LolA [Acetobacteraceae bacterium]